MDLDRRGREWVSWDIDGPAGEMDVMFDGADWHPLERVGDTVRVLVAGPDATANPDGVVVLGMGRHTAIIRSTAGSEVLIRKAGPVDVLEYR